MNPDFLDEGVGERLPWPAEVHALLERLSSDVQAVLGERLVGLYVHGSLAYGDFNLETSDIDSHSTRQAFCPATNVTHRRRHEFDRYRQPHAPPGSLG